MTDQVKTNKPTTEDPQTRVVIETPVDKEAQKLQKDIEASKLIQRQLLKDRQDDRETASPRVKMARQFESPRDKWVAKNYPESIEEHADRKQPTKVTKPATVQVMFDDPGLHDIHIAQGWEPIIRDGRHFRERGDLGYTMPMELYRKPKVDAAEAARLAAQSAVQAIQEANAKLPREIDDL